MCSGNMAEAFNTGICKERIFLHSRKQIKLPTNWWQRFKAAPISTCTAPTHTTVLLSSADEHFLIHKRNFMSQVTNFKETFITFSYFKKKKRKNKQQCSKVIAPAEMTSSFFGYSRFRNKWIWLFTTYAQTQQKLRTLKLPQQSLV